MIINDNRITVFTLNVQCHLKKEKERNIEKKITVIKTYIWLNAKILCIIELYKHSVINVHV